MEVSKEVYNKYFGDVLPIEVDYDKIKIESNDIELKNNEEAEAVLKFLKNMCKITNVYNSKHPLGRGTITLDCGGKKVDIIVHGDWTPDRTYIRIYTY